MTEEIKVLARRYWEDLWNGRNPNVADELIASDYVDHHFPPDLPLGPSGVKQWLKGGIDAFPDFHIQIEDLIAEGDKVVTRFTFTGTHQGEFAGVSATGKKISLTAINIMRIENGKLAEAWEDADLFGLMQQFGVITS